MISGVDVHDKIDAMVMGKVETFLFTFLYCLVALLVIFAT